MGRSMSTRKAALGAAILVPLAACGGGGGTGVGGYLGAGVVSVQSSASGSGARVDFYPASGSSGSSGCDVATHGDCNATACPNSSGGGTFSQPNAGNVTVTVGGQVLTLAPDPMFDTVDASVAGALWTRPGVDVAVVATGAEVPAFTLHTPSPAGITVTAPSFPDGTKAMTIHTETDLPVSWTGGGDSTFTIVTCTVPAKSGHAVVPASLLGMMPKGKEGSIDISVGTSSTSMSSGWAITLDASLEGKASGNTLDGTSSNYSAQIE